MYLDTTSSRPCLYNYLSRTAIKLGQKHILDQNIQKFLLKTWNNNSGIIINSKTSKKSYTI